MYHIKVSCYKSEVSFPITKKIERKNDITKHNDKRVTIES